MNLADRARPAGRRGPACATRRRRHRSALYGGSRWLVPAMVRHAGMDVGSVRVVVRAPALLTRLARGLNFPPAHNLARRRMSRIHDVLDLAWDVDELRQILEADVDPDERDANGETPIHIAARRYRMEATRMLLDAGADMDAKTRGGKTAFAHAIRRGFDDLAAWLVGRGADTTLTAADRLAILLTHGDVDGARRLLTARPDLARTGNPEEDRILADLAGRSDDAPVQLLVAAGADLEARGLDDGTPLHQAAWFGQAVNARLLLDAGAPIDVFDGVHRSSPLGWAVHGSRYSGDAEFRQEGYVAITRMLLDAGARLTYPDEPDSRSYVQRLLADASAEVLVVLREYGLDD